MSSHQHRGVVSDPRLWITGLLTLILLLTAVAGVSARLVEPDDSPMPTLTTDKSDYAPDETVIIRGTGFEPGITYDIPVIRPDGQIAIYVPPPPPPAPPEGPIVYSPDDWQPGWGSVTADSSGDFTYQYRLNGIQGFYEVRAYPEAWSGDTSETPLTVVYFTDAGLTLVKEASSDLPGGSGEYYFDAAGDVITYKYTVTNNTANPVSGIGITDNKFVGPACTIAGPIPANGSAFCTATYTINDADGGDMDKGMVTNVASAAGAAPLSSLPDTETVTLPLDCYEDSEGANDEPGQKDLTQLCFAEVQYIQEHPVVTWNWDIIQQSGNNSSDACALFDIDAPGDPGYGLTDYALCVTWKKDGTTGLPVQVVGSPKLYTCADTRADRCAGADAGVGVTDSYCALDVTVDDPFPAGEAYPKDTKAYCSIDMTEMGGGATPATLLDVCSYPSQQPNSDPSDCVFIPGTGGAIKIVKDVVPDDP
jgi:hypothetical protein